MDPIFDPRNRIGWWSARLGGGVRKALALGLLESALPESGQEQPPTSLEFTM